jgi:ABC-type amino acid transport substrate-binding protein
MNKYRLFSAATFLLFSCLTTVSADTNNLAQLDYLTEDYPPYNFKDNGQAKGVAVDILLAAIAQVGTRFDSENIRFLPWARAYKQALANPNTVLFSTTHSEKRKALFQWVGPIANSRIVLLAKKSSKIIIKTNNDLANLRIGVIRDDIGEQLLMMATMPKLTLEYINNPTSLALMLDRNRIDVWAYEENVARWFIRKNKLNSDDFEIVHVLFESQIYFALSNDISQDTAEQLQLGIDKLKCTKSTQNMSVYDEILTRYSL